MNVDLQQYQDMKIFMKYVIPSQHVIMEFAFITRVSILVSIMLFLEIDAVLGNGCIAVFCFVCFTYALPFKRSSYQKWRVWIPLTGLSLPHFCTCPKPGPRLSTS